MWHQHPQQMCSCLTRACMCLLENQDSLVDTMIISPWRTISGDSLFEEANVKWVNGWKVSKRCSKSLHGWRIIVLDPLLLFVIMQKSNGSLTVKVCFIEALLWFQSTHFSIRSFQCCGRSYSFSEIWNLHCRLVAISRIGMCLQARLFMFIDVSSMFSIFDDLLQKMKISELIDYSNAKLRKVLWFTLSCTRKSRLLWRLIQLIPRNGSKKCIPISWVSKQQAIYLVIYANIPF